MRDFYLNIYRRADGTIWRGHPHPDRESADAVALFSARHTHSRCLYRIHVRTF